jgi:prepilin-type N-terminal cleavage/methylation domain-containing protein
MGKNNMQRHKGFTMIEVLIVIAIIGILAAITNFAWHRLVFNTNLRAAAREIEADLKLIKERARADSSSGTVYSITFNLGANNYSMIGSTGTKSPTAFASDIRITSMVDGAGNNITSGTQTITCLARGTFRDDTSANPASGSLTLTNQRGSTATITFNATGRTYVSFASQ